MKRYRLQKDVAGAIRGGHPWIYRDALGRFDAAPGAVVRIDRADGRFVAIAIADGGPIAARVVSLGGGEAVDAALFRARVETAAALRRKVVPRETDAFRALHGEGDRVPGVVCDVYGRSAVVRLDGHAMDGFAVGIAEALRDAYRLEGAILRRGRREDEAPRALFGEVPRGATTVKENGMRLSVDLHAGQKTGLFLDHRDSRARARELASGARVLNLYGYTGGFSVAAGLGGAARVDTVDLSKPALAFADRDWAANGLDPARHASHASDAERFLEGARARGERWDLVIADPPSFAPSHAARAKAITAYRALHRACLELVTPGGLYLAASCSSHVDREAFERTIRDGAEKAKRAVSVIGRWGAAADHPRLLAFPEGDYLAVTLLAVG